MKRFLFASFIILLALLIVFLPDLANAQPPPPPEKPDQAPIDGGLGILAAVGGAYAIKKMRDRKK
ncbi:MAG: hypothetical protein EA391_02155 [Balneolaceae bacterium]|nr:MAG: hypothetical protein EA391_02155 [Balneolaceae bacterium]